MSKKNSRSFFQKSSLWLDVTFGSLKVTFVVPTNLWCGRLWECVGGLGEVCKVFESELSDDVSKGRPLVPVSVLACVVMLCL